MNQLIGKNSKAIYRLAASVVHAIILMIVTLVYLALPFSLDDELILIELSSAVKKSFFREGEKPPRDRFLFIDISWEKQLIDKTDSLGIPIGKIDITDRESLGKLVHTFNQNPNYEFVIIDIQFYLPSSKDSLLAHELKKLQKGLVSYHKDKKDAPKYPIFKAPLGLSDMEGQIKDNMDDIVLKYHLIQGDSLKTTPLLMFEQLYNTKLKKGLLYDQLKGETIFNSYILDFYINSIDLFKKKAYNHVYLQELLYLSPEEIHDYTNDRIVIVGDFENKDIHKTIQGEMPGPLILLNAFLSLEKGQNILSPWWVLTILLFYILISYKCITYKDPVTRYLEKKFKKYNFVVEFAADVSFYLIYFGLVSLLSFALFNIHLTILIMAFYMHFLEAGINLLAENKEKKKKAKLALQTQAEEAKK
ncbi:hypothetical protein AAG747_18410 [Rapidithrix thailandica]|uniref:CHASE2 domain-containing protein n=1 Tax=Rapidithrix thailandica TaxID=413964 RepID=A0AAW9SC14_9BACT